MSRATAVLPAVSVLMALCGLTACPVSAQETAAAAALHVSPDGADANPGTLAQPFASLERARDAIREIKQRSGLPPGGVTVFLREGVYNRQATFALGREDSGTPEAPITWAAYPGETVTLFGGTPLQHDWFVPVADGAVLERVICEEARGRLLQADLRAHGITDHGELSRRGFHKANLGKTPPVMLYVGGERMTLARWPNPDEHFPQMLWQGDNQRRGVVARSAIVDPGPKAADPDFLERGGTFSYDFDRPALWSQAEDIWLDGIFTWSWEWSYNQVARLDHDNRQITLRYGEVSAIQDKYSGNFFFAENLLEEIDLPGEYYLDRATGILYFLPTEAFERGAPVWLSTLPSLMLELENVSDVVVRDLVLDTGRGGGFAVRNGTRVRIERCEITNLAGAAGHMTGTQCALVSSHIHHVGGSGLWVGGGDMRTLTPAGNVVENCEFHDWAWFHRVYTPAVGLSGVGQRVAHNLIYNCPHGAMLLHGNDHVVEYNEFHDICREFIDLGAIYINVGHSPLQRGWVIRRNVFRDIATGPEAPINIEAVYVDHGSQGGLVEENYFVRIGHGARRWAANAIKNTGGLFTIARHNVFVDCTTAWRSALLAPPPDYVASRYESYNYADYFAGFDLQTAPHPGKYPEVRPFLPGAPPPTEEDLWLRFEGNVIWNPTVPRWQSDGIYVQDRRGDEAEKFNPLVTAGNWVTEDDPGFADFAAGDLALREDAPVFTHIPVFPHIPFGEIGLTGPVGPASRRAGP